MADYVNGPYGQQSTSGYAPLLNYYPNQIGGGGTAPTTGGFPGQVWDASIGAYVWSNASNPFPTVQNSGPAPTSSTGYPAIGTPSAPTGGLSSGTGGSYGNATTTAAQNFLNQVISGQTVPYDQATKDNMLTQASDMNSAGETARNQTMEGNALAGGASLTDPSLAGARMNSMARRQTDNTIAANKIGQVASQANFGARLNAAGTLADIGLAQEDRQAWAQALLASGAYNDYSGSAAQSGNSTPYPTGPSSTATGGQLGIVSETPQQRQARLAREAQAAQQQQQNTVLSPIDYSR